MKRSILIIGALLIVSAICFGVFSFVIYSSMDSNDEETIEALLNESVRGRTTTYYAYDKGELCRVYQNSDGKCQTYVRLEDVCDYLKLGFISAEDRGFYNHCGIDIRRTLGAAINYIFHPSRGFGASTITQQVIKNVSGRAERTLGRKICEMIRAIRIEQRHTKDEIFEAYLNVIPMSRNVYGVYEASMVYFGKTPKELDLAEAATIVGITNAPSKYDPFKNPEACLNKRNNVLYAMLDNKSITREEYDKAKSVPLAVADNSGINDDVSSWFIESARKEILSDLMSEYGISLSAARLLLSNGTRVILTMDMEIQKLLEERFEDTSKFSEAIDDGLSYAMVINDVKSGNTVGIVGGVGKKSADKILNMAEIKRPPASTFKPLAIYAPAIDRGLINWATVFDDVPLSFEKKSAETVPYPKNSPDQYDGLTTVKDAVRLSKNTVAMRIYEMRGAKAVISDLEKLFDIKLCEKDNSAAPLALGQLTEGITLRQLVNAYTVFPRDGVSAGGKCYEEVLDAENNTILRQNSKSDRVIKPATAQIMNQLLMTVTDSGTARSLEIKNYIATAGKTGTSSMDRDRLFVGYTPFYCAGIWCGYKDSDNAVERGVSGHLKIWDDVMQAVHQQKLSKNQYNQSFSTDKLVLKKYCKDSGERIKEECLLDPRQNREEYGYFSLDDQPREYCSRHIAVLYDRSTDAVAGRGCPEEELELISLVEVERSFPCEITVTDAEYVYRTDPYLVIPPTYELPYFYGLLEDGEHVGRGKNKKQFNSGCYIHNG